MRVDTQQTIENNKIYIMTRKIKVSKRNVFLFFVVALFIKSLTNNVELIGSLNANESFITSLSSQTSVRKEVIDKQIYLKPHGEAQSPDGSFGYIYPVTSIRERKLLEMEEKVATSKNFLPMSYEEYKEVCEKNAGFGFEAEGADLLLFDVEVDGLSTTQSEDETSNEKEEINLDMANHVSRLANETKESILQLYKASALNETKSKSKVVKGVPDDNDDPLEEVQNENNSSIEETSLAKSKIKAARGIVDDISMSVEESEEVHTSFREGHREGTILAKSKSTRKKIIKEKVKGSKKEKISLIEETSLSESKQKVMKEVASNIDKPVKKPKKERETSKHRRTSVTSSFTSSRPRILCAVYTHAQRHSQLQSIINTWGWRCDGFFAASTVTDPVVGAIKLTHEGKESYENMWQKARSVWAYIYDHYMEDYDFFFLGGDDVHLVVENLREYLWNMKETLGDEIVLGQPLYLGQHIPLYGGTRYFVGGAPGVVLNKNTLQQAIEKTLPTCFANHTFTADDRLLSLCLEDIGIYGNDTADSEGKQRFHTMDPEYIVNFDGKRGFFKRVYDFWAMKHGLKVGKEIVSRKSISFHYLNSSYKMKRHHALLYRSCPLESKLSTSVVQLETLAILKKYNITEDFLKFKLIQMKFGDDGEA